MTTDTKARKPRRTLTEREQALQRLRDASAAAWEAATVLDCQLIGLRYVRSVLARQFAESEAAAAFLDADLEPRIAAVEDAYRAAREEQKEARIRLWGAAQSMPDAPAAADSELSRPGQLTT